MKIVPDPEPELDADEALGKIAWGTSRAHQTLADERATRAQLREALTDIIEPFIALDLHLVAGGRLPDVWQMHRETPEQVPQSLSDAVLQAGITASVCYLRAHPHDTEGASKILDACLSAARSA